MREVAEAEYSLLERNSVAVPAPTTLQELQE